MNEFTVDSKYENEVLSSSLCELCSYCGHVCLFQAHVDPHTPEPTAETACYNIAIKLARTRRFTMNCVVGFYSTCVNTIKSYFEGNIKESFNGTMLKTIDCLFTFENGVPLMR